MRHAGQNARTAFEGTAAVSRPLACQSVLSVLALTALLALAAMVSSPAEAHQARLFTGTFGAAVSATPNPYPLGRGAWSLAVDSTSDVSKGDVYVTDTTNHRVEKFDSSGHFLFMFGKEVNKTAIIESATRGAEEDVCPAVGHKHDECKAGAAESTPGALNEPSVIAVDSSSGPSKGDVYVNTGTGTAAQNEIQQLELTGATGGSFTLSYEGQTTSPISMQSENLEGAVAFALEKLPALSGNVATAGTSQSGSTLNIGIRFNEKLDATNVPQITVNASGLTPSSATASTSTVTEGRVGTPDSIAKFDPEGHLVSAWASGGRLDGSTAPGGPFSGHLVGVAVDAAGNLWVLGRGRASHAFEFRQDASPIIGWIWEGPFGGGDGGGEAAGLALDSEDDLFYRTEEDLLLKFTAAGTRLGSVVNTSPSPNLFYQVRGYAVDPISNDLFVAVESGLPASYTEVQRYAGPDCHPSGDKDPCTPVESFGRGRLESVGQPYTGLAVDPSSLADTVYVLGNENAQVAAFSTESVPDVATAKASGFTSGSATLNGTVSPSGAPITGCFFEWGETTSYGHTAECEPSAGSLGSGSSPLPVHANVSVEFGKTYHFRLVASNAATDLAEEPSRGSDLAFGPPLIESGSALSVSATSVTLQLQVNPNDVDTHARIEYGAEAGVYTNATQMVDLGAGGTVQSVSFNLQGLASNSTYHYRVSAQSALGNPEGPDLTFTTQGLFASTLPDSRGWELVSPPDKHGVRVEAAWAEGGAVIQAAADGTAITYAAASSIGAEASGNRSIDNSQLLSTRGEAGLRSWSTRDVSTPHQAPVGVIVGKPSEYMLFSTDLSVGAVEPFGATPLSPSATEKTPYLLEPDHSWLPLVTAANVPPGIEFGGNLPKGKTQVEENVEFMTATPDLSHVLLESSQTLTSEFAPGFDPHYSGKRNVYEWSAGALQLASWIPTGAASACGGTGPTCVPASEHGQTSTVGSGRVHKGLRHIVSSDGSRVVFSSEMGGVSYLYLRDLPRGETVALEVPQAGAIGVSGRAVYQDASVDDSRVFFTDGSRLTVNSTAGEQAPDLYMCQVEEKEGQLACRLTDLTANMHNPTEPADVLGAIAGVSEDGSSVYFVANGALTVGEGAVHGDCEGNVVSLVSLPDQSCNLYRYDTETGSTRLIAVVSGNDHPDWGEIPVGSLTARVSPNGRYLAFMSQRSLTGYDNRDAVSGQRDEEVYLYDAAANGGEGRLVCASCNPTGSRPHGLFEAGGFGGGVLVDPYRLWEGQTLAASVPGWTKITVNEALYQSRYLSNSGRLFFNAADALVPQDTNGIEDVYEFEFPQGPGQLASDSCSTASPTYSLVSGGCVDPISSGSSPEESVFLDASESGNDVFFLTASRLAPKDVDGAADVYDASVGGGEEEPVKPPPCEGDACQNPVQAPDDPTPGSLTFSGPGNPTSGGQSNLSKSRKKIVRCKKARKLSHGACVKAKSKKGRARKGRRAGYNRRTGR
jgi:Tol biopolymer transport system component